MTGSELRKHRESAGVKAVDVARVLGVTRSAITHLEGRDQVQPVTASRFLTSVAVIAAQQQISAEGIVAGSDARRLMGAALVDMGTKVLTGAVDG